MSRINGLVLAGGLMILGAASTADAQVAVSVGNPFVGRGVYVGAGAYPAPVVGGVGYVGAPVVAPVYPAYPTVGIGIGAVGYPAYRPIYGGYAYRPYYGGFRRGGYRRW
jgi:hypothetical protein